MKYFWWSCPDPMNQGSPILWTHDIGTSDIMQHSWMDAAQMSDLLNRGFAEISWQTAHKLGWPV